MRQYVNCDDNTFESFYEKLDNHNQERVTWDEFTDWLKKTGE